MRYIPKDLDIANDDAEKRNYGICGPSAIAVLLGSEIGDIIANWTNGYYGHAPRKEMISELKKYGFKPKIKLAKQKRELQLPMGVDRAIARIQWEGDRDGDFAGWGHWVVATQNTHYIFMQREDEKVVMFCSNAGWFVDNTQFAQHYLERGFITSFIAV